MTTGLLAIPSVRGKKDAIVSKFCGLSCEGGKGYFRDP